MMATASMRGDIKKRTHGALKPRRGKMMATASMRGGINKRTHVAMPRDGLTKKRSKP